MRRAVPTLLLLTLLATGSIAGERRLPDWYESSRVHAHTRLPLRRIDEAVFASAPKDLADLGVRVLGRHVKSGREGPWWHSAIGERAEGAKGREVASEIIAGARENGLRLIAYYWMMSDDVFATRYPDWRGREPDGSAARNPRGDSLCLNSPYRQVVKRRIVELTKMGADGIMFDERHQPRDGCWCPFCARILKAETGLDLPAGKNPADPAYRELVGLYNRTLERTFAEFSKAVHEVNPEAVLSVSTTYVPGLVDPRMTTELVRIADVAKNEWNLGVTQSRRLFRVRSELAPPPPDVQQALGFTVLRDAADGRPPHVWVSGLTTAHQALATSAALISHGCVANLDMIEDRIPDPVFAAAFALDRIVGPELAYARPIRHVALLHSERARDLALPNLGRAWKDVLAPLSFAYGTLLRARIPVGIVNDGQLRRGELNGYRALFVPRPAGLTPALEAEIEKFAESGGVVIRNDPAAAWHDPEKRPGLAKALLERVPAGAPTAVSGGPEKLHATTFRSEDGRRLLVALANDFSWYRHPVRDEKPPPDPEIEPARGVTVFLRGPAPALVTEVVSGAVLECAPAEGGVRVEVPTFAHLALLRVEAAE